MNLARSAVDRVVAPLRATASDRLVRNAGWMYANVGLSAVLGMIGWIIAARLYTPFDQWFRPGRVRRAEAASAERAARIVEAVVTAAEQAGWPRIPLPPSPIP